MDYEELKEKYRKIKKKPSKAWYLLPIFFGIVGGVIGYFVLRKRDREFAERVLIIGLVMILAGGLVSFLLAGLAYLYIAGYIGEHKPVEKIFDVISNCKNGTARIYIKNLGNEKVQASTYACVETSDIPCSETCTPVDIEAGERKTITIGGCASGIHTWSIIPSNGTPITTLTVCT